MLISRRSHHRPFRCLLVLAFVLFSLSALFLLYSFSREQQQLLQQQSSLAQIDDEQQTTTYNRQMASRQDAKLISVSGIPPQPIPHSSASADLRTAICIIDGKQRVPCIRNVSSAATDEEEAFLPFNHFLRKHFDVSGHFGAGADKSDHFYYYTSDQKTRSTIAHVVEQQQRQNGGQQQQHPLMQFNNVALRLCVKCLSAENGLPMSMQWAASRQMPYFYPVQVLQFGMEHLVKNQSGTTVPMVRRVVLEAERRRKEHDDGNGELAIERDQHVEIQLHADPSLPILFFTWHTTSPEARFEITFTESNKRKSRHLRLEFRQTDKRSCVWRTEEEEEENDRKEKELHFVYGLNNSSSRIAAADQFHEFLLDMHVFVTKALALLAPDENDRECRRGHQQLQTDFLPTSLRVFGPARLKTDSIRQQASANAEIVERVAQWLLDNQNGKGGWAVPIQRTFSIDGGEHRLVLEPGWHNAMAQGHALSFLARVFDATRDQRFLAAAHRALALFDVPASDGGILNRLFGVDWFEEFPVTQSNGTFVLNGFLYALIGLHDFAAHSQRSQELFWHGTSSLRTLLPLFDCGIRSTYDLRHIPLGSRPNIARWDYHALHVVLLQWMHRQTNETLLKQTAKRWADYANGMPLKHN